MMPIMNPPYEYVHNRINAERPYVQPLIVPNQFYNKSNNIQSTSILQT